MATVRDVLNARIQRLVAKRQAAVLLAQALQTEIDALRAERDSLTQADEDRFLRLQNLTVIRAED